MQANNIKSIKTVVDEVPSQPDLEHGQSLYRLINVTIALLYFVGLYLAGWRNELLVSASVLLAYAAFIVYKVVSTSLSPQFSFWRCVRAVVFDQFFISLMVIVSGPFGTPFSFFPGVASIGYGLRYGKKFCYFSCAIGSVFLSAAMYFSEFWQQIPFVAASVILGTCWLPLYSTALAGKLARDRREMELRSIQFEIASKTDSLTGVLNRAGFSDAIEKLMTGIKNQGVKSAIMILDLDGFKAVNDLAGHGAGDAVLKEVALRLKQRLRISDEIARIGGDEFGIILHNLAVDKNVAVIAQEILDAISGIDMAFDRACTLSASIGICVLPNPTLTNQEALMKAADTLMYEAKNAGKNQFRVSYP
ncbi:MAG TPA: GGDEF domain-containing protein [Burkholderiaceae bacterium]|jgi:diguanylate cyclase (GGDEF)-like protein|nr:GGDEF domain-containing protein [Burkholderiaceae bacterium]